MSEEKLPNGWKSKSLKELFKLYYGKGLSTSELKEEGFNVYGANGIIGKYDRFLFENSMLIISCRGAASGAIHKTNPKSFVTSNSIILDVISKEKIDLDYARYAMILADKSDVITGTAQPQITIQLLQDLKLPIAPLREQQRIVSHLDTVFGHLDVLREKLDRIPVLLKNFRQQVLTQAVTGELTRVWREGKDLGEWEEIPLSGLIVEKPRNGYSPKAVDFVTEVKSLTLSATTKGYFDPTHVKYLDIEKPEKDSHLWLKNGDILIQRSNSLDYVGTAAIYDDEDNEFIYPDLMMKLRANDQIQNKYLFYVLSSNSTKDYFKKNASGTAGNMPKINQGTVMNTPIPYPSLEEQGLIVEKVDSLFELADKIESQYQSLKIRIDQMPQAILAKAFRGELFGQEVKEYVREIGELGMVAEGVVEYQNSPHLKSE